MNTKNIFVAVVLISIWGILSCSGNDIKDSDIAMQYNSLKDETEMLYDSIANLNILINSTASYPELLDQSNDNFDGGKAVRNALLNAPQVLPEKAELGGRMHFNDIKVLNEKWVYASYTDGHIQNQVIYSYEKSSNNTYTFQVILKLNK